MSTDPLISADHSVELSWRMAVLVKRLLVDSQLIVELIQTSVQNTLLMEENPFDNFIRQMHALGRGSR